MNYKRFEFRGLPFRAVLATEEASKEADSPKGQPAKVKKKKHQKRQTALAVPLVLHRL